MAPFPEAPSMTWCHSGPSLSCPACRCVSPLSLLRPHRLHLCVATNKAIQNTKGATAAHSRACDVAGRAVVAGSIFLRACVCACEGKDKSVCFEREFYERHWVPLPVVGLNRAAGWRRLESLTTSCPATPGFPYFQKNKIKKVAGSTFLRAMRQGVNYAPLARDSD